MQDGTTRAPLRRPRPRGRSNHTRGRACHNAEGPRERVSAGWRAARAVAIALLVLAGFAAACRLDYPVWKRPRWNGGVETEPGRLLRVVGYAPTWLLVGATLILVDCSNRRRGRVAPVARNRCHMRGGALILSVALSGGMSEAAKLVVRREKPPEAGLPWDGVYVFRSFQDDPGSTAGLGLPSGHASVAFGAAWILVLLYPWSAPVLIPLAVCCAASRVLVGAHFVSDVYASAVLASPVAWGVWRGCLAWQRRRLARLSVDA